MTSGRYGLVLRAVSRLLEGGTVASLGAGTLLERFAADRDGAAFEALVSRHGPMVLGTCRRMLSDPHDVEDAFQATFLVLARKAGSIQDPDRLAPWLHGVARRVATRSRAVSSRRKSVERPAVEEPADESPDRLEGLEVRAILDEELARLPEKYRVPLVLCYLEGLTHDEAAEALRWPVGTVRSRLAGGRDRLRDRLKRRGLAPSAAVPTLLARASIPQALLTTTVRVATSAGTVPAHVLTLAKGALIAMTWNKLKMVAALGLMAGLTVGGAGLAAQKEKGEPGKAETEVQTAGKRIDQIKNERERIKQELGAATRKVEELQFRLGKLEEEWKAVAAAGGGIAPVPEAKPAGATSETIENPMGTLQAMTSAVEQRIQQLQSEQARQIRQLERYLEDLNGQKRELALQAEKLKGGASAAPTTSNDRIKQLEAELQAARAETQDLRQRMEAVATNMARPVLNGPASPKPEAPGKKAELPPGVGGIGGGSPPPTLEERKANTRPRPPAPMIMPMGGSRILLMPAERDRATVLNTEDGTRATQRLPEGATEVMPVTSAGVVAFSIKGPEIRQVAAYDNQSGKWYSLDLKEPTTHANPIVGTNEVTYQIGRFLYIFSAQAKKWSVLELKRDPGRGSNFHPGMGGMHDGKLIVPEGDVIHLYDAKTGEWTHIDTKDDGAK